MPWSYQFWLLDASITYRLSKQHGLIEIGVKKAFDKDFQFQDTAFYIWGKEVTFLFGILPSEE